MQESCSHECPSSHVSRESGWGPGGADTILFFESLGWSTLLGRDKELPDMYAFELGSSGGTDGHCRQCDRQIGECESPGLRCLINVEQRRAPVVSPWEVEVGHLLSLWVFGALSLLVFSISWVQKISPDYELWESRDNTCLVLCCTPSTSTVLIEGAQYNMLNEWMNIFLMPMAGCSRPQTMILYRAWILRKLPNQDLSNPFQPSGSHTPSGPRWTNVAHHIQ